MRLGLFGGSFDPVHLGHLILAETCREAARLDAVWLIPAAAPPHKRRELSPGADRLAMLQLAISGNDALQADDLELRRGGVSYTVDTLREVRARLPHAELFLLIGADSLHDFPTWRAPEQILQLARPLVVRRPGAAAPDLNVLAPLTTRSQRESWEDPVIDMPAIEISSTDLRRRVAEGASIRYRTTAAVEQYIHQHGLYRSQPASGESPR